MSQNGLSFLYQFDVGNRNIYNPGANIISVTSQAAGDFDKSNLCTESVRQVWRSTDALSWQDIVIEADVETLTDTFGILGHNFTESAVVKLEANFSNDWSSPPVSLILPWSYQNIVNTNPLGDTYRYFRVRILDPSNPCGFVEVGRLVGGRALIMQNEEDMSDDFEISYEDMAKKMKTEGFFRASNENVKVRSLSVKLSKFYTSPGRDDNFLALRRMFRSVGTTRPVLAMVNRGDPSFCSLWGQFNDIPSEGFTILQFMSESIKLEEVF